MSRLRPFFSYYGSKWRAAPKYPVPTEDTIIEPFAGSAAYSLCYPTKKVILNDLNPKVAALWKYLTSKTTTREVILQIPLPETKDQLAEIKCEEERILIGFWWGKALVEPATTPTGWLNKTEKCYKSVYSIQYWGDNRKKRIADQIDSIKHWEISDKSYEELANQKATWFIDPPYDNAAGAAYTHGPDDINYQELGKWCQNRDGQVIICENQGAKWLPSTGRIESLGKLKTARKGKSEEVFWTNVTPT